MIQLFTKKRRKGFTLIELIVVIAILGILAAIAVPRFGAFSDSAALRADEANIKTLEGAAQMYIAAQAGSPATVDMAEQVTTTEAGASLIAPYVKLPLLQPGLAVGYKVSIAAGVVTVEK